MFGMKNKDLIMLGIIVGIAFIFIGAIISNVFPSSESDMIGYQVSAFIKMIGIGFLVCSMVVGGIIVEDIDKNIRMLLLLFGLILLIVYTIGAQQLQWDISYAAMDAGESPGDIAYEERPTGYGVPGFEILSVFAAAFVAILVIKFKKHAK